MSLDVVVRKDGTVDVSRVAESLDRMLETQEPTKGREPVEAGIKSFINNVQQFEVLDTYARGPMVITERIDHFSSFQIKNWHGVGVFWVKDGKIVEWSDYTMSTTPA